jgi:hypothetical protein
MRVLRGVGWVGCLVVANLVGRDAFAQERREDNAGGGDADAQQKLEQLQGVIAAGADLERTKYTIDHLELTLLGAGLAGFSVYGYTQTDDGWVKGSAIAGMVIGGLYVLTGTLGLALGGGGTLAQLEKQTGDLPPAAAHVRLAQIEGGLRKMALLENEHRRSSGVWRTITGSLLVVVAGVVFAVDTDTTTRTERNVIAGFAGLVGLDALFDGIGKLTWRRAPAEIVYDTWVRSREAAPAPSSRPASHAVVVSPPLLRF